MIAFNRNGSKEFLFQYIEPLCISRRDTSAKTIKMSRHKLVKTMDLDDELDDVDGGDGYDNNYGAGNGEDGMEEISKHLA